MVMLMLNVNDVDNTTLLNLNPATEDPEKSR